MYIKNATKTTKSQNKQTMDKNQQKKLHINTNYKKIKFPYFTTISSVDVEKKIIW